MQSTTVYKPDDPAFAEDFVEFSNSWSRAQVKAAWAANTEGPLLDALRPKIVALRLTCEGAPPITEPADLTPERTEQMDTRLYTWFAGVWIAHLGALANLGNALRQTLFAMSALDETTLPKATTRTTTPARHRRKR